MTDADLFGQAKITDSRAVCLGRSVVCDGFEPGFHAAAFTHMHHDYISDKFETCMHNYPVYTSKITAELLEAITDDTYSGRMQLHAIDYDVPNDVWGKKHAGDIRFLEPGHALCSSQVLFVTHDGLRILYAGDISPLDKPPRCDVLVIDSTHSGPNLDRSVSGDGMEKRLTDAVIENIASERPVCVHTHRGRLQRLMHLLSERGEVPDDARFLAAETDIRVAEIYRKHGYGIKDLVDLHEYEGEEITTGDYPWVEFTTSMEPTPREMKGKVSMITVSGSYGNMVMEQDREKIWTASDEPAEFADILKYVKAAEPRAAVTDDSLTPHGWTLADAIKSDLGIESKHMPG